MLITAALACLLTPVTLQISAPNAKGVSFAGDVYGWDRPRPMTKRGADWVALFDLPRDARFEYKFIVDGKWILDPRAPKIDNTIGGENSVYEGPGYKRRIHDEAPRHPMRRIPLKVDGRVVIVFAPVRANGLPLLIYGDGQNYERYGKIQNVVENLIEAGRIRPVVLVLVPPTDRMKEYGVEWKSYASFLLDGVLPAARQATGASAKAQDVFIGGSSLGGLIALRLAEELPDKVAGGVHSQSGAFQPLRFAPDLPNPISAPSLKKLAPTTRLWICWGNFERELTRANEQGAKTLIALHQPFGSRVTNEGHNWTAWRNRMEDALVYLLGKRR